jgi:hypothetical protein
MVYVIQTAVYKPVWHIPLLSVQWITPDDGQRNCPNHVEFHFQNKSEKFVHQVGFIIRNLPRCTVTWMQNLWHQVSCTWQLTFFLIASNFMSGIHIGPAGQTHVHCRTSGCSPPLKECRLDPQCNRMSLKFKDRYDSGVVRQRKSARLLPAIPVL